MVGGNAARVYGFDMDVAGADRRRRRPHRRSTSTVPLKRDDIPDEALRCPAFAIGKFRPDPDLD